MIAECTRCGNERKVMPMLMVRMGGHSLPSLTQPDLARAVPATVERTCGDCITDDEILHELSPIMEFGLGVLINRIQPEFSDMRVALEVARTMFMVRNNNPDGHARRAAVKALGLDLVLCVDGSVRPMEAGDKGAGE